MYSRLVLTWKSPTALIVADFMARPTTGVSGFVGINLPIFQGEPIQPRVPRNRAGGCGSGSEVLLR